MTDSLIEGVIKAFQLIFSLDPEVYRVAGLSLYVSALAVFMAAIWSIPIAATLGLKNFRGRKIIRGTFNAFIGFPTVVLGLVLFLIFARNGPLGLFGLMFTPLMISIGQSILITPIIVSFITSAIESIDTDLRDLAKTLGSNEFEATIAILREASGGIILAVLAAFNRAFAELGVAMMVGGNIYNKTRVLTTAIALQTNRGDISQSIALGIILVSIVYILNITINYLRRR